MIHNRMVVTAAHCQGKDERTRIKVSVAAVVLIFPHQPVWQVEHILLINFSNIDHRLHFYPHYTTPPKLVRLGEHTVAGYGKQEQSSGKLPAEQNFDIGPKDVFVHEVRKERYSQP